MFGNNGELRLLATVTVFPAISLVLTYILFRLTQQRLLHPPDVGSEGQEVIDTETEVKKAVGLVIHRDRFPDNLFAPAKRHTLMPEHINPVYDKEMRSEIFAQGTLMLRVVIQVSMFLALPLMGICLFVKPEWSTWYISYVVLFNMLVGPVFSAGSITSERERETLDLLLTTILSPAQILWGKLFSGLRVSSVLTAFLLWPLILAAVLTKFYWTNYLLTIAYLSIVGLSCLVTSSLGLFCSVFFKKSATSMMTAYMAIIALFCFPVALKFFAFTFFPDTPLAQTVNYLGVMSPFATIFELPMEVETNSGVVREGEISLFLLYVSFTAFMVATLWGVIIWLFNLRWRVAN
jgi:ABC-type transport system involved in multi-copper enzyme maturation permease subunit